MYKPQRLPTSGARFGKAWSPFLALCLAAAVIFQVLPIAPFRAGLSVDKTDVTTDTFFEPLQICGDGGDLSCFSADHFRASGTGGNEAFFPERICCDTPDGGSCTKEYRSNVFRPPRLFLS